MNSEDRIIPSRKEILLHFDKNDVVMAQLIRKFGPIKLKRNRNYFIVLCNAIIVSRFQLLQLVLLQPALTSFLMGIPQLLGQ